MADSISASPENGTSSAAGSRLMQKLRQRHLDAVSGFQAAAREMSSALDSDEFRVLADLRTSLATSRKASEEQVAAALAAIEHQRAATAAVAVAGAQPPPTGGAVGANGGPSASVYQDTIHVDGALSTDSRREQMMKWRSSILEIGVALRAAHEERLGLIDGATDWLRDCEARRRQKIKQLLERLLLDITTVAFTNVTQSQLLVQRAAVSVNEQLLTNQVAAHRLLSQLRQHEILKHRALLEDLARCHAEAREVMRAAAIQWTKALLSSAAFHAPSSRASLLKRIAQSYAKSQAEVGHMLHGLVTLVGTLLQRRGARSSGEICGGTEAAGWLRTYCEAPRQPVFPTSPMVVAEEWRVFVEVILDNAQMSVASLCGDCETIEAQLRAEMERICGVLEDDVAFCLTPTSEEIEIVRKVVGCDREAVEEEAIDLFPFAGVLATPSPAALEEVQLEARAAVEPFCEAVVKESAWFVRQVGLRLEEQKQRAVDALILGPGSYILTLSDATRALEATATPPLQRLRDHFVFHEEAFLDYQDQLRWLEEEFADSMDCLAHAGTVEAATETCLKCQAILDRIEALYRAHHKQRVSSLEPLMLSLRAALDSGISSLHGALMVTTPDAVAAHNSAVDAELQRDRECARAAGTKEAKNAPPAPASAPVPDKINAAELKLMRLPNGSEYLITHDDVGFGYPDGIPPPQRERAASTLQQQQKHESVTAAAAAAATATAAKEDGTPTTKPGAAATTGKPPRGKRGAPSANDATVTEGEAGATAKEEEERESTTPFACFVTSMTAAMDVIFHSECLFSARALPDFKATVREAILQWSEELRHNAITTAIEFNRRTKEEVDALTNKNIRHHQRRAPTLQAQVYEARLQELQDASSARAKQLAWMHQRVAACREACQALAKQSNAVFVDEIAALVAHAAGLPSLMSMGALEAHRRAFVHKREKLETAVAARDAQIRAHLDHHLTAVLKECDQYTAERLRTFAEGGSLSPEEARHSAEQLASIRADSNRASDEVLATAAKAVEVQLKQSAEEASAYEQRFALNVDELRFLNSMQELFAQAKGRISTLISASVNAQAALDAAVAHLDSLVSEGSTRADVRSLTAAYLGVDYETAGILRSKGIDVDAPAWANDDAQLSHRLRRARVDAEALVSTSRAMQLLRALDNLRRALFARGLYLGCLQYGCEFIPLSPSTLIDQHAADGSSGDAAAGGSSGDTLNAADGPTAAEQPSPVSNVKKGAAPGGSPSGSKAGPGKAQQGGAGGAPPLDATTTSSLGGEAWNDFMRVERAEKQTQRILAPSKAQLLQAAQEYFQKTGNVPMMRVEQLGADLVQVSATIAARTSEQEARSAAHVAESVKKFREQVQRSHQLVHRVAQEVFLSIFNLSAEALEVRIKEIIAVFNAYYSSMVGYKRHHGGLLKGSLATPSNRARLEEVAEAEAHRQRRSAAIVVKFWGILLREVQGESTRIATRSASTLQSLFTMLKSLVTPQHLVPGEEVVVGQHRGLKRLLRQRQREELAKRLEGATSGADAGAASKKGAAAGNGGGKKADASSKKMATKEGGAAGKKGLKGAAAAAAEDDDLPQLPHLEQPTQEFVGVQLNAVRVFDQFKRSNPAVELKNHLQLPSQWDAGKGRAAADGGGGGSPQAPANPTGKTGAAPGKAAQGKTAAKVAVSTKVQQQQQQQEDKDGEGNSILGSGDAPHFTPTITAVKDRLHQQAALHRQQTTDQFAAFCLAFSGGVERKFGELAALEAEWKASWDAATASLRTENCKKPASTSSESKPSQGGAGAAQAPAKSK